MSLASSDASTIISSAGGDFFRGYNSGPLLVAGQDNPRRPKPSELDERQLLRLSGFKVGWPACRGHAVLSRRVAKGGGPSCSVRKLGSSIVRIDYMPDYVLLL